MSKPKPSAFTLITAMRAPSAPVEVPETTTDDKPTWRRAATRQGTTLVAAHVSRSTHKALKHIGTEDGLSMQQILEEALSDWLIKKGATKFVKA